MGLAEQIKPGDWRSVRSAIAKLNTKLGPTSVPTFAGLTLSKTCTIAAGLNVLRVTGLQTDDIAMSGTLRGAYIDVSNGSEAATGTIRGMELKARTEAPGDTGSDVAVLEGLSISADSKGHSVTTMRAAEFILDGKTGGTIDEAVGLRIANNLQIDKATKSYGIQIYRDSFDYTADIQLSSGGLIGGTDGMLQVTLGDLTVDTDTLVVDAVNHTVEPKILELVTTTSSTTGVIRKGADSFIHDFHHPTGNTAAPLNENVFIGRLAGNFTMGSEATATWQATRNVGIGYRALQFNTLGFYNVALGSYALNHNTTGVSNFGLGYESLYRNQTGNNNVAIGTQAGKGASEQSHSNNTFIGDRAGISIETGSSNLFLGKLAGSRQTTLSNLLIIDNRQRADVATELTNAILYGVMAAAPTDQTLRLNATVTHGENKGNESFWWYCKYMDAINVSKGGSGATEVLPTADTIGGYRLTAVNHYLYFNGGVCNNWDGATDIEVKIRWELGAAGAGGNTVDLTLLSRYKGTGDIACKTQTQTVPVTLVGTGQYTMYTTTFTIDWDLADNIVEEGDVFSFRLNLDTVGSEVDNVIVNFGRFRYRTATKQPVYVS